MAERRAALPPLLALLPPRLPPRLPLARPRVLLRCASMKSGRCAGRRGGCGASSCGGGGGGGGGWSLCAEAALLRVSRECSGTRDAERDRAAPLTDTCALPFCSEMEMARRGSSSCVVQFPFPRPRGVMPLGVHKAKKMGNWDGVCITCMGTGVWVFVVAAVAVDEWTSEW